MKLLRKGKLPAPRIFYGTCPHCRAIVECEQSEIRIDQGERNYSKSTYTVICPTQGCTEHINLSEGRYPGEL